MYTIQATELEVFTTLVTELKMFTTLVTELLMLENTSYSPKNGTQR